MDKYGGSKVTVIGHDNVKKKYRNCTDIIEINHGNFLIVLPRANHLCQYFTPRSG